LYQELFVKVNNLKVCYQDSKTIGSDMLVILHGWGANKETMAPILNCFGDKYRIVVPDMPGCGKTEEPDRPWNTDDYVYFFKDFLDAILPNRSDKSINVMGHSNGGMVLIKWASENPPELNKLILVDSAGIPAKHSLGWYVKVYSYKAIKKLMKMPLLGKSIELATEDMRSSAGSEDYRNASPIMKQTMSALLAEDVRKYISKIKVSTLLVWGDKDTATPLSDGILMNKLISDSGIVTLEGCGHFSYLEQIGRFNSVLDYFLSH